MERIEQLLAEERSRSQAPAFSGVLDDWPVPQTIQGELPPVEPFSEDLLPQSFRALVRDISDRMQVPLDYPAVMNVVCLAGVVNGRVRMQPKENDTRWVVVPNLFGGIVAPPGYMKSPVIAATTRPLIGIQAEWRNEHEEALAEYARILEEWELNRSVWKDQFKANAKGKEKKAPPERPGNPPDEPKAKRLIANDCTFEAAHKLMNENPAGFLVIRDELAGWWSQLDRAGREGERAFFLESWNGDSSFTLDRIGRGTIHVPNCCLSMLGGLQPGRLRSYLTDALKDGPSNDGLIQRFQLLVWPDTAPDWNYVDRPPDVASEEQAARVFRTLVELNPENPARFRFAREAQELFTEFLADLEAKVRGDELHPALISHLSKYRSLMPSLAVLFELADLAATGFAGFDGSLQAESAVMWVSLDHAKQAAAWCDYLESHAKRVYSCVISPQMRAARELAERIKKRKVGADGSFSRRDVYSKGWSGLDDPTTVRLAAEILVEAKWLRETSVESGPGGGRPSTEYLINPRLWK